jgi:hypothetical protein
MTMTPIVISSRFFCPPHKEIFFPAPIVEGWKEF